MTKDEALKLALEALVLNNAEWKALADSGDAGFWQAEEQDHYKQTEQAITAIKEALAQPEQEPVAILHRYPSKCRMTVEYTDEITEVREGSWPLYTTPPQSKPLTDEEIILIVAECAASHQHTDIHFARAIERAHGIKELV